ncbi:hypothetical protein F3Y22_tig00000518pilonHSYRG00013 [Hibiscus syriacus]|uniref:Uncharacterized protein n=1 Tax=Hibiscus syriacus TaxID=106335 RepID=A0A6A3D6Z1_HIBSY|nr:hypothetical protein F3Y22_tig00000518pilonHSYRG00013 [Hibiscus syriacus]
MDEYMYCKDLHELVIYKDKVEGKSDAQWELLNRKVVAMIRKYIDKIIFEHVSTYPYNPTILLYSGRISKLENYTLVLS